ncbi:MAG: ATP-binding protein, partial [Verrucomicrobiota bacterium]
MSYFFIVCGIALAIFFAAKYFRLKNAVRLLSESLSSRTSILTHSEEFRGNNRHWINLIDQLNELIQEIGVLEKQNTGRLQQIETTLGSLQEGVLIADRDNYILLANKALKENFPAIESWEGVRLESVLHSAEFLVFIDELKTSGSQGLLKEIVFSKGRREAWMEVSAAVLTEVGEGRSPWYLFVLHDITQLKRLESMRKQFVANASHELKTPVAMIKGYAETLVTDHETMNGEDRLHFMTTIHRHSERLSLLINDLLSLSALESDSLKLDLKKVRVGGWLREIATDYGANLESHGREFQIDSGLSDDDIVSLDIMKIRQVIDNLVENARKYSPDDSLIELGGRVVRDQIEIWVRDEGPGVPANDLNRIFERFYRVEKGRSRETGGTGLGLAIVKHIIESHGGRVWAENGEEDGLRITISFPKVTNFQFGRQSLRTA